MMPKEFINQVFVNELEKLKDSNPYISFAIMAIGIEFLGKCLDTNTQDWNKPSMSKIHFELAINNLSSLEKYREYLISHKLWDSLRNGFAHSFVPKYTLSLSSKDEAPHFYIKNNGLTVNLRCEDFYVDFRDACLEVIDKKFNDPNDKMNKDVLSVPHEQRVIDRQYSVSSSAF